MRSLPRLRRVRAPALALLPVLALFFALHSVRLDATPLLNPDEAAYTEPALTLLTAGRFGAPMYSGLLAIDQRWYFLWPGYAVLATVPYALLGVDVLAVRALSLVFGAILVGAVWWLTRDLAAGLVERGEASSSGGALVPALAAAAALLAFLHPTLFVLSRFGRPEIAVAALTVLSSALGARAGRRAGAGPLWAAAGMAAALAFLMHQYGAFALVALGAALVLRRPGDWRRARSAMLAAAAGALAVLLPWLLWVASDAPEFAAQLGVQLAYQRWRYPDAGPLASLGRDLPGRYLLNRQDYPSGWQPWAELVPLLLGPRFLQGPSGAAPLPLLKWLAAVPLYWLQLGAGGLYRWAVLALVLSTAVLLPPVHRRHPQVLRWVALPLLVWLIGLAAIPNKWEGYTGPVAAYSVAGACLLLVAIRRPARRALAAAPLALCAALWLGADVLLLLQPATPYARFAGRLRAAVPAGEPVATSMREWFAFAGRNPAVTYEFRSVPAFDTSVLEMVRTQRPRYLVLHRRQPDGQADGQADGQRYFFIAAPWGPLYAYLDSATDQVALIEDETYGTVEVRRVRAYPD